MGKALYRKYRPRNLKEVVGQDHITKTLGQAIKTGRISHAYLFTGPKGVGKTSVARILAHEINNIEYSDDSSNIDIIEIDAASNRRIDEIRDLREKVYIAPTMSKYKVYIIDEVHMLTNEAFNALLKTLEEPPEHIVFILATTDAHRLPDTIISRTQRYVFRPIQISDTENYLKVISIKEKISIDDAALSLIAKHSGGSLRDAESLLDQAKNYSDNIDLDSVALLLGLPPQQIVNELYDQILSSNPDISLIINNLTNLFDQGYPASNIAKSIAETLRQSIIGNKLAASDHTRVLKVLNDLIEVPASLSPSDKLELVLIEHLNNNAAIESPPVKVKEEVSHIEEESSLSGIEASTISLPDKEPEPELIENVQVETETEDDLWTKVLANLKLSHNTLYGIAKMAKPSYPKNNEIDLVFNFEFHKKRLDETANKQILLDIIKKLSGKNYKIECYLDKNSKVEPKQTKKSIPQEDNLSQISNIFSGAELLES